MLDELAPFLTVGQAAKALQLGRSKTYELTVEWERTGGETGIPFVWFGNQKRVPRDALVRYVEDLLGRPPAA
jgi:excisionase family DNA binding protein